MPSRLSAGLRRAERRLPGWREAGRAWAEIAGLWSLAVARPVFELIANGPEALSMFGAGRAVVIATIAMVVLLAPTVLLAVEVLIGRLVSVRLARIAHAIFLGGLVAAIIWQWMLQQDASAAARQLLPLLVWAVVAVAYLRLALIKVFAGVLGFATPLVVILFCLNAPVFAALKPVPSPPETNRAASDTPVVMIVLDELPLTLLENRRQHLDGRLFPNLAALGRTATWYRQARTTGTQTLYAVPSIFTGTDPFKWGKFPETPPTNSDFPANLCTMLRQSGYATYGFEAITDFCPSPYGFGTRLSTVISKGVRTDLLPGNLVQDASNKLSYRFPGMYWYRDQLFNAFADGLSDRDRTFNYLHIELPHTPWTFLPDGQQYPLLTDEGVALSYWTHEPNKVARTMQQTMLQTAYADREIGKVRQRLERLGTWNKSLVIVTADHGESFTAGDGHRVLTRTNAGWILRVPLLVKYPGQNRGKVSDAYVDQTDIAPTILDAAGVTPPDEVTGTPLPDVRRPAPRTVHAIGYGGKRRTWPLVEVDRQAAAARAERNSLFGSGSFYAIGGHASLLGRRTADVPGLSRVSPRPSGPTQFDDFDPAAPIVPAYYQTTVKTPSGRHPGPIAVSVDGRIAATTRAWWEDYGGWTAGVVLPVKDFSAGDNRVAAYEIEPGRR